MANGDCQASHHTIIAVTTNNTCTFKSLILRLLLGVFAATQKRHRLSDFECCLLIQRLWCDTHADCRYTALSCLTNTARAPSLRAMCGEGGRGVVVGVKGVRGIG